MQKEESKKESIVLLNCPFCGGAAKIESKGREWDRQLYHSTFIECEVCGAKTREVWNPLYNDIPNVREREVIEKWNKRRPMEQIVERLEEEKKKYKEECSRDIDNYRQYVRRTHVYICKFIDIVRAYGKE